MAYFKAFFIFELVSYALHILLLAQVIPGVLDLIKYEYLKENYNFIYLLHI